jgi:hypothetical protein
MDYELENLGPERFQQFCQSLLVSELPHMTCFPIGQPDGGRDALRALPNEGDAASFVIYQIKFSRNPSTIPDVRKWLRERTAAEQDKVKRLIERGAKQYVLLTNIPGTAHLDVGSIDSLMIELRHDLGIPIECWWRDDINRRLDGNWDIKLRYPEVISSHDFFRILLETASGQERERRLNAIRSFLVAQYDEDFEVKFKQVELHNKLLDLFVDLPFRATIRTKAIGRGPFDFPQRLRMHVHSGESPGTLVATNSDLEGDLTGTATLLLSEFGNNIYLRL